jgi:hypothetical protein
MQNRMLTNILLNTICDAAYCKEIIFKLHKYLHPYIYMSSNGWTSVSGFLKQWRIFAYLMKVLRKLNLIPSEKGSIGKSRNKFFTSCVWSGVGGRCSCWRCYCARWIQFFMKKAAKEILKRNFCFYLCRDVCLAVM